MRGRIADRSAARLQCRALALALSISLGACDFIAEDGESQRLRTSLHQSVTAAGGMPAAARPAPAAQAPVVPSTPVVLNAITAGNVDELERLLGPLQAAYERGDLPQNRLWAVFGLFDKVIPGTLPDGWVVRYQGRTRATGRIGDPHAVAAGAEADLLRGLRARDANRGTRAIIT
jgi:hypothetical protein